MLIPSHNFHFVCFILGIVDHLNAFLHFLMSQITAVWAQLLHWSYNKSTEAWVKAFAVNRPVAGCGVGGGGLVFGLFPVTTVYSYPKFTAQQPYESITEYHQPLTYCTSKYVSIYTTKKKKMNETQRAELIRRNVFFSFLPSMIAFLSRWIYEELRGSGSSPSLQKKTEVEVWSYNQSCGSSDANHLSLLFPGRLKPFFNRISGGTGSILLMA